jgi:hypothetical protein
LSLLEAHKMNQLSAEILKVTKFAQGLHYFKKDKDKIINFLISLDFLVKGVMTHWQIKLQTSDSARDQKAKQMMRGVDIKFPLLIGDQYHSIAYFMGTRTGNIELVRILTLIEENFQKIFFNIEKMTENFKDNLMLIYQHFYNYLPQFMGNSLKGVAIIFELNNEQI